MKYKTTNVIPGQAADSMTEEEHQPIKPQSQKGALISRIPEVTIHKSAFEPHIFLDGLEYNYPIQVASPVLVYAKRISMKHSRSYKYVLKACALCMRS